MNPSGSFSVIWRFPEITRIMAVTTWLMPRVAMNELTFSLTTTKPLANPTAAQASTANTAASQIG